MDLMEWCDSLFTLGVASQGLLIVFLFCERAGGGGAPTERRMVKQGVDLIHCSYMFRSKPCVGFVNRMRYSWEKRSHLLSTFSFDLAQSSPLFLMRIPSLRYLLQPICLSIFSSHHGIKQRRCRAPKGNLSLRSS